jgi:hypothetical protein
MTKSRLSCAWTVLVGIKVGTAMLKMRKRDSNRRDFLFIVFLLIEIGIAVAIAFGHTGPFSSGGHLRLVRLISMKTMPTCRIHDPD